MLSNSCRPSIEPSAATLPQEALHCFYCQTGPPAPDIGIPPSLLCFWFFIVVLPGMSGPVSSVRDWRGFVTPSKCGGHSHSLKLASLPTCQGLALSGLVLSNPLSRVFHQSLSRSSTRGDKTLCQCQRQASHGPGHVQQRTVVPTFGPGPIWPHNLCCSPGPLRSQRSCRFLLSQSNRNLSLAPEPDSATLYQCG